MSPELIAAITIGVTLGLAILAFLMRGSWRMGSIETKVDTVVTLVTQITEDNKDINTRVSHLEGAAGDD